MLRASRTLSVAAVTALAAAGGITVAQSAQLAASPAGTIVLRAGVIDISSAGIVATGSPNISSSQGTLTAPRFNVALDAHGRATQASATGGVHFSLAAVAGAYQTIVGTCTKLTLYPSTREAVLSGEVLATMTGPHVAPARISGSGAQLFGAIGGRSAHIEVINARGDIPSRT